MTLLSTGSPASAITGARFRAMATDVTFQIFEPTARAGRALELAEQVFHRVEAACTRFDPGSPLMLANAAGDRWFPVPQECLDALREAARAHHETGGLFDPRVLDTLVGLGYDRSLPFDGGSIELRARRSADPAALPGSAGLPGPSRWPAAVQPWAPGFDPDRGQVRIGPRRVDLGGIGKGLAVRWAAQVLAGSGTAQLIEAGGDCHLAGPGPEGNGWRVGVEDPDGAADARRTEGPADVGHTARSHRTARADGGQGAETPQPLAVLELRDLGCATSSLRKRNWTIGGQRVHHLIDPRTGTSAAGGLRAVTVVHPDPALAEVWSKALLIAGRDAIAGLARDRGLAALWADDGGRVGMSDPLRPHVIWEARR